MHADIELPFIIDMKYIYHIKDISNDLYDNIPLSTPISMQKSRD